MCVQYFWISIKDRVTWKEEQLVENFVPLFLSPLTTNTVSVLVLERNFRRFLVLSKKVSILHRACFFLGEKGRCDWNKQNCHRFVADETWLSVATGFAGGETIVHAVSFPFLLYLPCSHNSSSLIPPFHYPFDTNNNTNTNNHHHVYN